MFGGGRPNNNNGGINRPYRNPMRSNQTDELQQLRQVVQQQQNDLQQAQQQIQQLQQLQDENNRLRAELQTAQNTIQQMDESDDEANHISYLESEIIELKKANKQLRADIVEHENALEDEDNEVDELKTQLHLSQLRGNSLQSKYNHVLYVAGLVIDIRSLPGLVRKVGRDGQDIMLHHEAVIENPILPEKQRPMTNNRIRLLPSSINYLDTGSVRAVMDAVELLGPAVETKETETQTEQGGMDIEGAGGAAVPPPAEGGNVGGGGTGGGGGLTVENLSIGGGNTEGGNNSGGGNVDGAVPRAPPAGGAGDGGSAAAGGGNTTGGTAAAEGGPAQRNRSSTGGAMELELGGDGGNSEEGEFGVDRFAAVTEAEELEENQKIAALSKGDNATLKKMDSHISNVKNKFLDDHGRIMSRRESSGTVGGLNDTVTTLQFSRHKLIIGQTWQPEEIKDTYGDSFKHSEDQKPRLIKKNVQTALSKIIDMDDDDNLLTKYDLGVETMNRGAIFVKGSYMCPKTQSRVRLDEPVHSGNQDSSNIHSSWGNFDHDLKKIVVRGEEIDLQLKIDDCVERVQVLEKIGQMRKARYCKDERMEKYATIASGGCIGTPTINIVKAVWNKVKDQKKNNLPVFIALDTNPNGYHNALALKYAGVDVCLVLGDKRCLQKYGISGMGKLSAKDTKKLEEMFDESDLLDRDKRDCNGTYVNGEQHCSFKHPCLITIILNENDYEFKRFEEVIGANE